MPRNFQESDGVDTAFSMLLDELKAYLQHLNEAGAQAFANGHYTEVERLKGQAERVRALITRAEVLAEEWTQVRGERTLSIASLIKEEVERFDDTRPILPFTSTRKKSDQTPLRGLRTPAESYFIPILKALEEMGGKGKVSVILDRVWDQVRDRLTEFDLGHLRSGAIRWRNTAMWARKHLIDRGLLRKDSPRGIWEITPQGREYLARHCDLTGDLA